MSIDPSQLVPETVDGLSGEIPVIAYTEKVLAAKEAVLRKYIEENKAKIVNVEKELASLTLEVKLTSGSKKAALEHLRRKIEQSSEKIKAAKTKEEAAKKAWDAAAKVVADEEHEKEKLCIDLNMMVQENALQQYQKLEELTRKLDALNPEIAGGVFEVLEGLRAKIAPHGAPSLTPSGTNTNINGNSNTNTNGVSKEREKGGESGGLERNSSGCSATETIFSPAAQADGQLSEKKAGAHVPLRGKGGRGGRGRARGGGPLVLKPGNALNQWTGAGFNVDDALD